MFKLKIRKIFFVFINFIKQFLKKEKFYDLQKLEKRLMFKYRKRLTVDEAVFVIFYNPCQYKYLPLTLKTSSITQIAVSRYGSNISYVPEEILTPQIILSALKNDIYSMFLLPPNMFTIEHKTFIANKIEDEKLVFEYPLSAWYGERIALSTAAYDG